MRCRVGRVESLDATPGKGADFDRFAGYLPLVPFDAVSIDLPIFEPNGHEFSHLRSFLEVLAAGGDRFPPVRFFMRNFGRHQHKEVEGHMESPGRIVYPIEGHAFTTKRDIVYRREGVDLLMDVYAPANAHPNNLLPSILFVHGGPVPAEIQAPKDWPFFQSYGELAAASGLIGVTFNHRFHHPLQFPDSKADVLAAIEFARTRATEFCIDAERIALWIFSGGGPHVSWLLRDRSSYVRCLIAFYAVLDLRHLAPSNADAQTLAGINEASAAMYVREGAKNLPMFIARAGLDSEMVNRGIDVFVQEALSANAFLDLANHRNGRHGFDFLDDNERSRSMIAGALAFAKMHLA